MQSDLNVLTHLYACFNARDIDGVLAGLAEDVVWANGMDGGHVRGHRAVRDYWTRQWAVISPHVEPVRFDTAADGCVTVTVQQTFRDLDGRPLPPQDHGLTDKRVLHVFGFRGGKVTRFDISDA